MKLLENILAKFINYVPSDEKKRIINLLRSSADFNEWIRFCESCIKKGMSSIALYDEIYFCSRSVLIDDDYSTKILVDVMEVLINNKLQPDAYSYLNHYNEVSY